MEQTNRDFQMKVGIEQRQFKTGLSFAKTVFVCVCVCATHMDES